MSIGNKAMLCYQQSCEKMYSEKNDGCIPIASTLQKVDFQQRNALLLLIFWVSQQLGQGMHLRQLHFYLSWIKNIYAHLFA